MNLVKTSIYTSISTAATFISAFIITKVVAVKIGPGGIAYVGQFQNTTAILTMLATGGLTAGVIKYLATYQNDKLKQQQVITTSLTIVLICSFFISLFVILSATRLSNFSFHTSGLWLVYILYGTFIFFISLNTLFTAFFNGLKNIKKLTVINVSGAAAGIVFTIIFADWLGVKGVLIAGNFMSLTVFCINIFFLRSHREFRFKPTFKKPDGKIIKMLLAFTLMNLVSGFIAPISQLFVRDKIIKDFSIDGAGYWQAITRISDYYLSFITTILSVYYLPRLSEILEKSELRKEILKGYKTILPVVGVLAFLIWVCKGFIVQILFTPKFLPMLPLFKYQLIGDFLKIGSWLLAFLMISKALTKTFIITEIIFTSTLIILSYILINKFGIIGATYAFCLNYALYWITMAFLMRKYLV